MTVATVSHTAVATVAAIELAGAQPLLLDVEPGGVTMDPAELAAVLARLPGLPPVAALATGLRALDLKKGYGRHYLRSEAEVAAEHARMRAAAEPVPGLAGGAPFELLGANEHTIRCSGRFDGSGYAARYYDVAAAMVDPAAHFHLHGWREGRLPTADPNWLAFKAAVDRVARQPRTNPYLDWFL